jgi:hypothetical protein
MRPVLAIALVLAVAACRRAPEADTSASPTSFEWKQVSPDGKLELRQKREASGCDVQVVPRPGEKPLWTSRICLPAPSGLFFLSPAGDKLLVLDLFPADAQGQDWSKVTLASLWTRGVVSRQYTGAELLAGDRVKDMRAVLSWLRGDTFDDVRAGARAVAGGAQVSLDLVDGRTILLGFEGAAVPAPPALSAKPVVPPARDTPAPAAEPPPPVELKTPATNVAVEPEAAGGIYRWEDEQGGLHFGPASDIPARLRKRAVPVTGSVGVVKLEKVQGGQAAPPAGANAPSGAPASGAGTAPAGAQPGATPAPAAGTAAPAAGTPPPAANPPPKS